MMSLQMCTASAPGSGRGARSTEAAGGSIRFGVRECWLGAILVAATEKGACAILLGDHPSIVVQDFRNCFANARLIGADAQFEPLVAKVVGLVEAPAQKPEFPLDLGGTEFEQRVWLALRDIPPGSTASYGEIAKRIGRPEAALDVAQACASNVLAVAIPCHRVVRANGALSGYRWGVARKRALLNREKTA